MKKKRALIIFAAVALLSALLLLSLKAYYVLGALVAGLLIMGHREIWSLIRYRRLPVIDERVRENLVKAVRNAAVFFVTRRRLVIRQRGPRLPVFLYLLRPRRA